MKKGQTQYLQLLKRIDHIFGSSYDLSNVIGRIYREIGHAMDTSNFYIALYDRAEKTISFEVYTIEGKEIHPHSRKLAKGLTEYVIRTKKPLRIDTNYNTICKRHRIQPRGRDAKSWLGVPMTYKNNVEGVITIQDYNRENVYSAEDESFLAGIASRAAVVVANTRLIEAEVKRAKELALLNKLAHRLTTDLKVDAILDNVTKAILRNFKNCNIAVFLTENGQVILKKSLRSFDHDVSQARIMRLGEQLLKAATKRAGSLVFNGAAKNRDYPVCAYHSATSGVAFPLRISDKTIGVLNIECSESGILDSDAVRILELIADRLSVALHNAQLFEDATNHAKQIAVSFTIFAQSLVSTELDDVLKEVLDVIGKTFGYTQSAVFLTDKEKNELYLKALHGYPAQAMKEIRLKIGKEGICGHVAATGKPYYAPDVTKDSHYLMKQKSIKSEAAVPLKVRGETIGVLDIGSEKPGAFSESDLRMFSVFASQAAIAIENARLYNETKGLSLTDSLTRIANRRHFDLMLDSEFKKAKGFSRPLSLAMVDLDDFKTFNDRYGHVAGDKMLIHIARTLRRNIRDTDFLARYGGEEFVIIFPETNNYFAVEVAERLRNAVEQSLLVLEGTDKKSMTISVGIASYPTNAQSIVELIESADKALYRAKQQGRNRVETI